MRPHGAGGGPGLPPQIRGQALGTGDMEGELLGLGEPYPQGVGPQCPVQVVPLSLSVSLEG